VDLPPEYAPKNDAEIQRLTQAADFAFKQCFAICPSSPEIVILYVNFLVKQGRKADALAVAHAVAMIDPKNEIFRQVEKNLTAQVDFSPTDSQVDNSAKTATRLHELQALRVQKETEYN
jgi:hypothetical protein